MAKATPAGSATFVYVAEGEGNAGGERNVCGNERAAALLDQERWRLPAPADQRVSNVIVVPIIGLDRLGEV
jgi:hypothetical protein